MQHLFLIFYTLVIIAGIFNVCGFLFPIQSPIMSKYTQQSVNVWMKPNGFFAILLGIGMAFFDAYVWRGTKSIFLLILGGILIAVAIAGSFVIIKKLVKN